MALKTPMDWLGLSISDDPTRPNLTRIWRDKTTLVSTDGHRMHMQSGLPARDKGSFVDDYDGEFPDWSMVLPKTAPSRSLVITTGKDLKDEILKLTSLCTLLKKFDKAAPVTLELGLMGGLQTTVLKSTINELSVSYHLGVPWCHDGTSFKIGFNLQYLIDALRMSEMGSGPIKMLFHGEFSPMVLESENHNLKALIMPMREGR